MMHFYMRVSLRKKRKGTRNFIADMIYFKCVLSGTTGSFGVRLILDNFHTATITRTFLPTFFLQIIEFFNTNLK